MIMMTLKRNVINDSFKPYILFGNFHIALTTYMPRRAVKPVNAFASMDVNWLLCKYLKKNLIVLLDHICYLHKFKHIYAANNRQVKTTKSYNFKTYVLAYVLKYVSKIKTKNHVWVPLHIYVQISFLKFNIKQMFNEFFHNSIGVSDVETRMEMTTFAVTRTILMWTDLINVCHFTSSSSVGMSGNISQTFSL